MNSTTMFNLAVGMPLGVSLVLLLRYLLSTNRILGEALRETSRFPLFAARDRLVCLVADGKMEEKDPAWQAIYSQVNFLLRMEQRLHLVDFATRYVKSQMQANHNAKYRAQLDRMRKIEAEAVARVPEFGAAIRAVNIGFIHIVHRRTSWVHRVFFWPLVIMSSLFGPNRIRGIRRAKDVRRAVVHPSPDSLRKWQAAEGACPAL